jgi:hypothetical protein
MDKRTSFYKEGINLGKWRQAGNSTIGKNTVITKQKWNYYCIIPHVQWKL